MYVVIKNIAVAQAGHSQHIAVAKHMKSPFRLPVCVLLVFDEIFIITVIIMPVS